MQNIRFSSLTCGQQIIIWASRCWLAGDKTWARAERDLRHAFGEPAGRVFGQALGSFLNILHTAATRQIGMRRPCCGRVAPDEILIARILANCHGEDAMPARALLEDLLPRTAARVAADYGVAAMEALSACGFSHRPEGVPRGDGGAQRFVHTVPRGLQ
ncbi:MAG: hypothetical protein QNJ94_12550 [Alphaproteobacteria bacterium]|nr:hypothetical protein [Alphaproteobacteria bacterium]